MKPGLPAEFNPETVAEAYLGLLAANGVEYLFANGGTDFAPLVEASVRARAQGWPQPQPVVVPHENLALAMAHGHAMVSGRAQAVMVHVGVGTANGINGLINASRERMPLLFTAGRTPVTESGAAPGARNANIHWAQEHFDQGGMLREWVKWDYELRHAENVGAVVERALAITHSEPMGPVYLSLPREVLAAGIDRSRALPRANLASATAPVADPATIDTVARLLLDAERPLVVTANAGRTAAGMTALTALADRFAVPVVQYRPRFLSISSEHPMHAGWDPHALLRHADLILVVECDVPWIPAQAGPADHATVVHIGVDPLFARYPLRGFRTDIALTGLAAPTLAAIAARASEFGPDDARLGARRASVGAAAADTRRRGRAGAAGTPASITGKWASACVNEVLDEDMRIVNEYPLVLEELELRHAGSYFGTPPSGGLGWGLGAALGAKLADPGKTVICAVGDGAYMFGNPTPAHFVSQAMQLPVLWLVFNNARWAAVHRATLSMYPKGQAAALERPPFATLEPSPRFEMVCEASGGYGERVTDPAQLKPALARALRVVREEGRQALLNLCLEVSYVKTS